jgi:phosphoglucosamine mutase
MISALMVLAQMAESGRTLGELRAMRRVPQILENVRVRNRTPIAEMPDVQRIIADAERRLAGAGRLLVRYSGTEMLARVMVEGEDAAQIKTLAQEISAAIQKHAGTP